MTTQTGVPYLYADATGALVTGNQRITMIAWVEDQASNKDIAADDDLLISDAAGNRIVGKRAAFAGDDLGISPCKPLLADGITVSLLDGGVVYIWVA